MQSKRKRSEQSNNLPKQRPKRHKTPRNVPTSSSDRNLADLRPISVNDLQWKAVEIPNQLDDYEGFFGLEEVENVEIVKDGNGRVSFKASLLDSKVVAPDAVANSNGQTDADGESEEGWGGFSEDDSSAHPDQVMTEVSDESKHRPAQHLSKLATPHDDDNDLQDISFEALADQQADDEVDMSAWVPLGLSPQTILSLSNLKFSRPTPIQETSIPEILAGHDVIGKASTGSGKTLAFGIPILERFLQTSSVQDSTHSSGALALILSPTRELAHQIKTHLAALCSVAEFSGPRIVTVTGGLSILKQERVLLAADIVVATPGRLWEVLSSGRELVSRLKEIKFLVIDEADRLLSEGHFKEVEDILSALDRSEVDENDDQDSESYTDRQTLIFSATFQKGLQQRLASKKPFNGDLMNKKESLEYLLSKVQFREEKPKFVDVNPIRQLAEGLKEGVVECGGTEKDLYLYTLLLLHPQTRTLVFTNSISAVRRLTPYLQSLNITAHALHSDMVQKARLRAVERFTSADSAVLIATDVAARGLDIPNIGLIIHYHLPRTADMYVHRSGRTARADNQGSSILLCAPEEVAGVKRLVGRVHSEDSSRKNKYDMQSIDVDRRVVTRLKPRASLAKKIADVNLAKAKGRSDDAWLREAAEELGVEYDSEEMDNMGSGKRGRGSGRKKKEKENRGVGREQLALWRAELKALLSQRVNLGISERYLARGVVDIDALLRGDSGDFLGTAIPLELNSV